MPVTTLPGLVAVAVLLLFVSLIRSGVRGSSVDAAGFGASEWLSRSSGILDSFDTSVDDPFAAINLDAEANNFLERRRRQLASTATTLGHFTGRPAKPKFEVSPSNPIYILFPVPKEEGKPEVNPFGITIAKVQPVVEIALDEVYKKKLVPEGAINITFEDTGLSDAHGPNVAIHALVQNRLDAIIGYAFVYALAPVARMSPHWKDKDSNGIPVITPIGLTSNLDNREEYALMTRISPPYKVVRDHIVALFKERKWVRTVYIFHDRRAGMAAPNIPYGECYLTMASIEPSLSKRHKMQHNYFMFDEGSVTEQMMKDYLMRASVISNESLATSPVTCSLATPSSSSLEPPVPPPCRGLHGGPSAFDGAQIGPTMSSSSSSLMAVVQWRRRRRSPSSLFSSIFANANVSLGIAFIAITLAVFIHPTDGQVISTLDSSPSPLNDGGIFPFHMLLILPSQESNNDKFGLTISKARPVIDIAVENVVKEGRMPPGWINISYHDSRYWEDTSLAERWSTYGVVEAYCQRRLDAIFGFADSYSLATIAKVSAGFGDGIPIFTTAGLTAQLGSRKDFPYLTRMQGSYRQMADSIYQLIAYKSKNETVVDDKPFNSSNLNYKHLVFMYHDKRRAFNKQRKYNEEQGEQEASSHCYFSLYAIKQYFAEKSEFFKTTWQITAPAVAFDEELNRTQSEVYDWLKMVSSYSNVIILCASPDTVREIMLSAHDLGMATSGEYVFINIDVSTGSHAEKPWIRANDTNQAENEKAKEAYKALKTISLRRSDLDEYKNFESRVKERAEQKYNYSAKTGKEYEMNNFISAFYDAVLLYAIALNETLAEGLDPRNGKNITSKMWNRTFVGITGNVSIDQNGDRYSDYSLLDLDPQLGKFVEVAYYSGANNQLNKMSHFHWVGGSPPKDQPICGWDHSKCDDGPQYYLYALLVSMVIIIALIIGLIFFYRKIKLERELAAMSWKIPWDELEGDDAERKERKKKRSRKMDLYNHPDQSEALLRSNSRVSITSDKFAEDELDVLAMRMRLRSSSSGATRKISAMIDRKLSIFTRKKSSPSDKIVENNHSNHYDERNVHSPSNSIATSKKKSSTEDDYDNNTKKSVSINNRKHSFSKYSMKSGGSVETIQMQNNAQIFTTTSTYKGQMVAIKKLAIDPKKTPKLELSRSLLMEFKAMKDLQHDHITRFAGACVEAPHYCIVTEYCPKGSLEDILENEKIKLDKMMKYSLLHDLVKGMYFLHNSVIRSHGKLKTSNCVVDSRFVLKITDFGLAELHDMEDTGAMELEEHSFYKKQLWTAPELLRMENRPYKGTQRGDVYSFALILHEMLYRHGAFYRGEDESPSPREIVYNVAKIPANEDLWYRPIIPEISPVEDNPETVKKLIDLMVNCWAEHPSDRPEFGVIRKIVHSLNKDNETANLVDNLLKRMEQYATNLEGLVEERTQEYLAEKKKVEDLLHQLLPPTVADQLIAGHAVQAESYDWVTIYFSDIVGFTALSSKSTPMQVVTLLNDLYLAFDSVVDNFKVYKVETIGDAYMVVSGLPERRDDHASQIARMSLELLQKVKNFVIRHRPSEQLKLRIGMHSGSVVAGVVGSKMPRYTLFGDCVNTSSRMESNGLPLRIHVSKTTKEILSKDPDFHLELRGEIEMKGKGLQTTYWLKSYKDIAVPDFGPEFR